MLFGLANISTIFWVIMNNILWILLNNSVVVSIDNILNNWKTKEQYNKQVNEVLFHILEYGLPARLEKYIFHIKKIEFLGYTIFD